MPTTPNLGLVNVLEGENFDIDVYNGNNDKVDEFSGTIEKDYILFKNANGATGTVALSESAANYNEIKIKLLYNDGVSNYVKQEAGLYNGDRTMFSFVLASGGPSISIASGKLTISGTSVTIYATNKGTISDASGNLTVDATTIKITDVVGVK